MRTGSDLPLLGLRRAALLASVVAAALPGLARAQPLHAAGAELQVNDYTSDSQHFPAVGMNGAGAFVVAWQSLGQDGSSYGIFAQRFDSSGGALGDEFQINVHTTDAEGSPTVGIDGSGGFVVAWSSNTRDGYSGGVFARRFGASGEGLGVEFQVNAYTSGYQRFPELAMDGSGAFVVAWQSSDQGSSIYDVLARRFDASGSALGGEFQVNTATLLQQTPPSIAVAGGGSFVVAWGSNGQDGSGYGVFAQRYGGTAILDVDANGDLGALTDGLLVLRYLFGFRGTTLVAGALDEGGCTRCDAASIEEYLATMI